MSLRLVIPGRAEVDGDIAVQRPWWRFSARFNVAIPQSVPVARVHERESEGVMMRWGLAHPSAEGHVVFTTSGVVRSDALHSSLTLRSAWLNGQRGIVPLAGFYLWQRTPLGLSQPYYVRLVNRPVFGVAVLWDRAETNEGEVIESCALIAVDANPLLSEIDNAGRQMPAILERSDYGAWLSGGVPSAEALLRPYPQSRVLCHPVGPYVNHLEFDEPVLIRPALP